MTFDEILEASKLQSAYENPSRYLLRLKPPPEPRAENTASYFQEGNTLFCWPWCKECKQPFSFDAEEPFAYCGCGTTEWGHPRPAPWMTPPELLPSCPAEELEAAIAFAVTAHFKQVYKGYGERQDQPYILHLIRVMMSVPDDCKVEAILHDSLEDTGKLPWWVRVEQNPIRSAVLRGLTRQKDEGESYEAYIDRIIAIEDPEARRRALTIKLADLKDNLKGDGPQKLATRYAAARFKVAEALLAGTNAVVPEGRKRKQP